MATNIHSNGNQNIASSNAIDEEATVAKPDMVEANKLSQNIFEEIKNATQTAEKLAMDYLNVDDDALESRLYMTKSIIPTLSFAMKDLLAEVSKRDIPMTEPPEMKFDIDLGPNEPRTAFDPINWLAQYLYRRNPSEYNAESHPYTKSLAEVSEELQNRIIAINNDRKARKKAHMLARKKRKEERRQKVIQVELHRRNMFDQLLLTLFDKWANGLWRKPNRFLFAHEVISMFRYIQQEAVILILEYPQINDTLKRSIKKLEDIVKDSTNLVKDKMKLKVDSSLFICTIFQSMVNGLWAQTVFQEFMQNISGKVDDIISKTTHDLKRFFFVPAILEEKTYGSITTRHISTFATIQNLKSHILKSLNDIIAILERRMEFEEVNEMKNHVEKYCGEENHLKYFELYPDENVENGDCTAGEKLMYEFKGFIKNTISIYGFKHTKILMHAIETCFGAGMEESINAYNEDFERAHLDYDPNDVTRINSMTSITDNEAELGEDWIEKYDARIQLIVPQLERLFEYTKIGAIKSNFQGIVRFIFKNPKSVSFKTEDDLLSWMTNVSFEEVQDMHVDGKEKDENIIGKMVQSWAECIVNQSSVIADSTFQEFMEEFVLYLDITNSSYHTIHQRVQNRLDLEARCMHEISLLEKRVDLNHFKICEQMTAILERILRNYYPVISVYTLLIEYPNTVKASAASRDQVRLRFVATSTKDRYFLLNQCLYPNEGISFSIMNEKRPRFIANVRDPSLEMKLFGLPPEEKTHHSSNPPEFIKKGSYYAVPLLSTNKSNSMGLIAIDNMDIYSSSVDIDQIQQEDMLFVHSTSKRLSQMLGAVDKRQKVNQLALYARRWIINQMDVEVNYIYVEDGKETTEDGGVRLVKNAWALTKIDDNESDVLLGNHEFTLINRDSFDKHYIWEAIYGGTRTDDASTSRKGFEAIPLLDDQDNVIAILSIRNLFNYSPVSSASGRKKSLSDSKSRRNSFVRDESQISSPGRLAPIDRRSSTQLTSQNNRRRSSVQSNSKSRQISTTSNKSAGKERLPEIQENFRSLINPMSIDQNFELSKMICAFEEGIGIIRMSGFGHLYDPILEGETIDDQAAIAMLYPRILLMNIRESLLSLDNNSMAEIKHYRKPPAIIHTIIKCVLYLFGKSKAQVETWIRAVKLINQELYSQMKSYDPTTIQRKRRFYRIRQELDNFPFTDVKKIGSKSIKEMYDWLQICLELRTIAVEARKRNKQLYIKKLKEAKKLLPVEEEEGAEITGKELHNDPE